MTSANRESIGYVEETDGWGITPDTPTGQLINFTGCSLGAENETTQSNSIRSDTNRAGTIRTGRSVAGDIGVELQYGAYDDFLSAVLRNAWSTALDIDGETTISFAASDNSINDSANGLGNAQVGQYVKVTNSAGNDGYGRVVTAAAGKITVAGITFTDEAAGAAIDVKGAVLANGTTQKSFTIERNFQDITQFLSFTGVRFDQFTLNVGTNDLVTASFNTMGKVPTRAGSTIFSAETPAVVTDTYNSVDDIKKIWIDDVLVTTDLTEISLQIGTNAQKRPAIGSLDGEGIIQNSISVSGTFTEYFENGTLLDKFNSFTSFDLAFALEDADGNAYVVHLPKCNPLRGTPDNGGLDTQITIPYNFDSTLDSTLARSVSISRIPA